MLQVKSKAADGASLANIESARDSSDEAGNQSQSRDKAKAPNELELDNIRNKLQQRLDELEPLPELLHSAELKLQDSNIRIRMLELENAELKRTIAEIQDPSTSKQTNPREYSTELQRQLAFKEDLIKDMKVIKLLFNKDFKYK
jgi:polyribonucleotide nucleotidyltransferase